MTRKANEAETFLKLQSLLSNFLREYRVYRKQGIPDCWSTIKDTKPINIRSTKMRSILRGKSSFIMVDPIHTYKEVTKAIRQKIMVIRLHKSSNRKRVNAKYVKDFKLAK